MKFQCTVKPLIGGQWLARAVSAPSGPAESVGGSRDEALEKLRAEIRYRLEWCPCSGVSDDYVELEVREDAPSRWRGSVF